MLGLFLRIAQFNTGLPEVQANAGTIERAFNLALAAAGAICVLIITIAGIQYIISQGDPQQVAKAKNTIIYAFVGLIIVATAFLISAFVIQGVTS